MPPEKVWLFHVLPDPMVGPVLYPLNELRERDPVTFARARAKYEGREQVLSLQVPLLDCLWNDVLHLSPVHPAEIIDALESAGFTPDRRRFFRVDANELAPRQTVLFLNSTDREHRFDASQWEWFDRTSVSRHTHLPQATRDHYSACAAEGSRPFLFPHCPHVLFHGSLDASRLDVVEV